MVRSTANRCSEYVMFLKGRGLLRSIITVFVQQTGIIFVMFFRAFGYPITNDYANLIKWLPSGSAVRVDLRIIGLHKWEGKYESD